MTTSDPSKSPSPLRSTRRARVDWTVMTLMCIGVAGYFVGRYYTADLQTLAAQKTGVASNYAHRALALRLVFYTHITMAGIALSVGPFQFSRALRRRAPRVHRWTGRVYVVSLAFGCVAAFVMSFFSSAGFAGFFGFGSLAVLWGWTTYRGYRAARLRDFRSHQAWMMRSFALTFAAPTLRLWLGALVGLYIAAGGRPEDAVNAVYPGVPFLAWLPNIVVAELMIRRRGLPGLRFVESAPRERVAGRASELAGGR